MAVYIVTGKLGAGKTLLLVQKVQDYLKQRRTVAVNIDVRMEKMCKPENDYSRLIRLPDLPTADDLMGLGFGCDSYDEEKFGGIFLDEAGVWLNSRDWNQGGRSDLLKFFLFLRKRRWDLWLCVQNISVIDKQIRESIAEHVVYINRLDRIKLPFMMRFLARIVTLGFWGGQFPKLHQAIVKYGAKANSPKVDDWYYRGEEYYDFYDTTQEYNKDYDKGIYSMLPPAYTRGNKLSPRNFRFFMRLTKIFFKRTKVINAFLLGGVLFAILTALIATTYFSITKPDSAVVEEKIDPALEHEASVSKLADEFGNLKIISYGKFAGDVLYVFSRDDGTRITSTDLVKKGIKVTDHGNSEAFLIRGRDFLQIHR